MIGEKKLMSEGEDRREDACEEKGMIKIRGFHRNRRSAVRAWPIKRIIPFSRNIATQ